MSGGGRFDFDDGGTYVGGWEDGKAHGFGVCTGPKGQGEYSGAWQAGYEFSGVYTWPSGNCYEGQWTQGKRHGAGIENKGRWVYRGEWTQGFKGRYGVRQSVSSGAKYEGTWTTGLQDGYGVETYADGGTYQGQWLRGMRHGYGVRTSVQYGLASHYRPKALRASLTSLRSEQEEDHVVKDRDRKLDESRGGFVLRAKSDDEVQLRRPSIFDKQGRTSLRRTLVQGLRLRKQKSTGDIIEAPPHRHRQQASVRSTISNTSHASGDSSQSGVTTGSMYTDSNNSFVSQDDINDSNVTETYTGEWKNDKRSGFGISERSDGLKYEGEWYNNKKYGYGVTTFKDQTREEGKYKNNVLVSSGKKSKFFLIRSSKLREGIDNAVAAAQRAAQIAQQKADIAISRMTNAREKADQADRAAVKSNEDSAKARIKAREVAPEFHQPGTDILKKRLQDQVMGAPPVADYASINPLTESNHVQPSRSKSLGPGGQEHMVNSVQSTPRSALVTSVLDSALAGSSTQIAENLRHLDETPAKKTVNHLSNVRSNHSTSSYGSSDIKANSLRSPASVTAGGPPPFKRSYAVPDQLPTSVRPNDRFSDLLNSTVVNDHFDQYGNPKDDSGLGRDFDMLDHQPNGIPLVQRSLRYKSVPPNARTPCEPAKPAMAPKPVDRSPDSGVSDTDDTSRPGGGTLRRRKTLPSIMKRVPSFSKNNKNKKASKAVATETAQSQRNLNQAETYIIENGIRKRVRAEVHAQAPSAQEQAPNQEDRVRDLPKRYTLESPSRLRGKRGSLPDVTACQDVTIMPREQVSLMSEKRREELRLIREAEERRRAQEIVLRLGDFKDWCQERQLMMLVIVLNVSLATVFVNLLS